MTQKMKAPSAAYLFLLLAGLAIFTPIMRHAIDNASDYRNHSRRAYQFPETSSHVSHVLLHAVIRAYDGLFNTAPRSDIMLLAMLTVLLPQPLIAFSVLKRAAKNHFPTAVIALLSLSMAIVTPITLWLDDVYMIGYLNPTIFHNPTFIVVRLFSIPLSLLAFRVLSYRPYRSLNHQAYVLILTATVLILSTLGKQNYTLVLIPALCLYALWHLATRQPIDRVLLVFGFVIPGAFILGLQYLVTYVGHSSGSSVAFGFLTAMQQHVPVWRLPIQLVLSLVFPIGVYALFFAEARRNRYLNFSWIVLGIGAAMAYSLYEAGPRWDDGNFIWGSYAAAYVLMFASLWFLIEQFVREKKATLRENQYSTLRVSLRIKLAMLLFALHVISGIVYCLWFQTLAM